MPRKKCEHNRQRYFCKDCKGKGICEHGHRKTYCVSCKGSQICVHNMRKYRCKECNGSGICKHNKLKSSCRECGGSSICIHDKDKRYCKECGGSKLCEHLVEKCRCKICKGSQICIHDKDKRYCRICNGSAYCEHDKKKEICKQCKGSQICIHNKDKTYCRECCGSAYCHHDTIKSYCKECKGSQICKHNKIIHNCNTCGGSSLCKSEFCETIANKKYDNYCVHCFINLFPGDSRTVNAYARSKEIKVVSYFNEYIMKGFIHDRPFYVNLRGGCCDSKRRIDLRKLCGNTMLCIEIDENEHKWYDPKDEENRYDNLFMDFSGKYIFIRYNPDKYKINGVSKNPQFETRMKRLKQEVDHQLGRIERNENELVEIIKLYYSS